MFKPIFIEESTTLDDCWHQLLWKLWENGRKYKISSGSHSGSNRLAFDFVSGWIKYPHTRPLAPKMPEGTNLPVPTTDQDIGLYFVNYLMDPTLEPDEEYRYSSFIVGQNRVCQTNQLEWIINHFKTHGYKNEHCYLTVGNTDSNLAYDRPFKRCPRCKRYFTIEQIYCDKCVDWLDLAPFSNENKQGEIRVALEIDESKRGTSPCLRGLDFRIIEDGGKKYLTTHVIYRSWDLWSGFPTNMGGFTLLNEYVASNLENVEPGPMSFSCKSLHAYEHHIEILAQRLGRKI